MAHIQFTLDPASILRVVLLLNHVWLMRKFKLAHGLNTAFDLDG